MSELKVNKISPRSGTEVAFNNNILFDTASKGIYLGVTTATASNLLNDYEEGTWTPNYSASGGGSATLSQPVGNYVKVGKIVHIQMRITTTGTPTLSGDITITGLPFTSDSTGNHHTQLCVQGFRFATDMPNLSASIRNNTTEIELEKGATDITGSRSYVTDSDISSGTNYNVLKIAGSYEVS